MKKLSEHRVSIPHHTPHHETSHQVTSHDEASDAEFLRRFEAHELSSFTHRDHLRMAFAYTRAGGVEHAITHARLGIRAFADAAGLPRKFHATLTMGWARVVGHMTLENPAADFEHFLEAHPELMQRDLLLRHYSYDHLFSEEARERFVEPDLVPLP
jgi:hypothetical protein